LLCCLGWGWRAGCWCCCWCVGRLRARRRNEMPHYASCSVSGWPQGLCSHVWCVTPLGHPWIVHAFSANAPYASTHLMLLTPAVDFVHTCQVV
jgi:hypothetical protein